MDMDEEALRAMMPMSFGKQTQKKKQDISGRVAKTRRVEAPEEEVAAPGPRPQQGPERPATKESTKVVDQAEDGDDQDGVGEDEDEDKEVGPPLPPAGNGGAAPEDDEEVDLGPEPETPSDELPVSHEIIMKDHSKTVSALAIDPAGARIASGSYDYDVKLWDFGGMDSGFRPFRSFEPAGSYQIHDLQFSTTGDSFLVISGTSQAQLYDRDGHPINTYQKGDVYLRDMRHTTGHVAELSSAAWHPQDRTTFITASADSTIRLWDVENKRKQKQIIVVKSKERGTRTKVTACAYSPDSKVIAGACLDGAIHLWSTAGTFTRPNATVENAHTKNTEISSIAFSVDNRTIATRGGDDTVKLWDCRSLKKPMSTRSGLTSYNAETNVIFSPDERHILTGVGVRKGEGMGKVVVMDRSTLDVVRTIGVSESSVVKVLWHSRINQIFTGSADGTVHGLYSPTSSIRGALLCVGKAPRARAVDDLDSQLDRPIITPHSLPAFREETTASQAAKKRKFEKLRNDARATKMPLRPMQGPGRGGRVGSSATQHVVQSIFRDNSRLEDPREALLKYANADEDPQWTSAWKKTQPKPVFDTNYDYEEEEGEEERGRGASASGSRR